MTSPEHSEGQPVVIGYDGSEFAKRAIREAGRLFRGRRAIVANTYPSTAATAAAIGVPVGVVAEAVDRMDYHFEPEVFTHRDLTTVIGIAKVLLDSIEQPAPASQHDPRSGAACARSSPSS